MNTLSITRESFGKAVAFFVIIISAVMIFEWREYESKVLKEASKALDNLTEARDRLDVLKESFEPQAPYDELRKTVYKQHF